MQQNPPAEGKGREALPLQEQSPSSSDQEQGAEIDGIQDYPQLEAWRVYLILLSLCIGLLLSMMDNSIISTSLYTIALYFNSLENSMWAVLAYTLSYLGFAVIFAQLSDFMGRKAAVLSAFTVFLAFSLGCGFAQTLEQLIIFRTFQGVGGSGLYALTLILSLEISTPKTLPLISGLIGATIAVAGVLGPVLGGILTERASWRWIFWINVPCGIIPMIIFTIATPRELPNEGKVRKRIANFDIIGSLLLLCAAVLVVFSIEEGGSGRYAWSSAVVIAPLVVGCLSWPALFSWEYWLSLPSAKSRSRWATIDAIYPTRIFTHRIMLAGIISTTFIGFVFFVLIFNLPLRSQTVNLDSPSTASVRLLPMLGALAVGSFLGGAASSKVNRTFHTFVTGTALVTLGVGLLSTVSSNLEVDKKIYGFEVIAGFGIGLTFSTVSLMTTKETEVEDHAVAQGIVSQVRVFGGSIGVAAANAMLRLEAQTHLAGILSSAQIRELQASPTIIETLNTTQRDSVRGAYAYAFNQTMRICVYMGCAAFVACLFTIQRIPGKSAREIRA